MLALRLVFDHHRRMTRLAPRSSPKPNEATFPDRVEKPPRRRIEVLGLLACACLVFTGCAHSIVISANPASIVREPGLPSRIDAKVGYFIPDNLQNVEVQTPGGGGDSVQYYPYRDLEPAFGNMLGNVYQSVAKLSATSDAKLLSDDGVKYVITPKVLTNSSSASGLRWPPTDFSVDLTCDVHRANGKLIASPRVVGIGHYAVPAIIIGSDMGTAGKRAMEDALLKMQRVLLELRYTDAPAQAPPGESSDTDTPKGSGSGAIITAQGHVLTAAHVVSNSKRVRVLTSQGVKAATILRVDESNDVAVLKISEGSYAPLAIALSRQVRLGQSVSTIGFPNVVMQGFSPKVTRGEISSLNGYADDPRLWQISVPVQMGNSGGPLLDENGNLVGVVVSKLGLRAAQVTGDLPQNVNYAVKSSYALALLEPYLSNDAPEPNQGTVKPRFEDMVAKAQQSVVLILVY